MPFLPPNQQRQSTEGTHCGAINDNRNSNWQTGDWVQVGGGVDLPVCERPAQAAFWALHDVES